MNIDELQPGPETDRLVAEALGFLPNTQFSPSTDLIEACYAVILAFSGDDEQ